MLFRYTKINDLTQILLERSQQNLDQKEPESEPL